MVSGDGAAEWGPRRELRREFFVGISSSELSRSGSGMEPERPRSSSTTFDLPKIFEIAGELGIFGGEDSGDDGAEKDNA